MKMKIHSKVSDFSIAELFDAVDVNDTDSIMETAIEALDDAFFDDINGCFDEIPMSKKSRGFFPDPNSIEEELCKQLIKCMKSKLGKKLYIDVVDDNEITIAAEAIDTEKILNNKFEYEYGYIYVGKIVLIMLKNFLINGVWNYGLKREDGTILTDVLDWPKPVSNGNSYTWQDSLGFLEPIIWFGIKNQNPIECWTLDRSHSTYELLKGYANHRVDSEIEVERWSRFWFYSFDILDWDTLFDNNGYCYIMWMFFEWDMDEPEVEFYGVRDSCPIKLDKEATSDSMIRKIDELFINKQVLT
jgi:hypothetical protein